MIPTFPGAFHHQRFEGILSSSPLDLDPSSASTSASAGAPFLPAPMFTPEQDQQHLLLALAQARKSEAEGGIPIG